MANHTMMTSRAIRLTVFAIISALFLIGTALPAFADGPTAQEQEARDIARQLQCPICENNSVLDSPSDLARDMRVQISEQLSQGKSRDDIFRYFVDRYGEGVLREPPKAGFALLVWIGPVIALGIAAAAV